MVTDEKGNSIGTVRDYLKDSNPKEVTVTITMTVEAPDEETARLKAFKLVDDSRIGAVMDYGELDGPFHISEISTRSK